MADRPLIDDPVGFGRIGDFVAGEIKVGHGVAAVFLRPGSVLVLTAPVIVAGPAAGLIRLGEEQRYEMTGRQALLGIFDLSGGEGFFGDLDQAILLGPGLNRISCEAVAEENPVLAAGLRKAIGGDIAAVSVAVVVRLKLGAHKAAFAIAGRVVGILVADHGRGILVDEVSAGDLHLRRGNRVAWSGSNRVALFARFG